MGGGAPSRFTVESVFQITPIPITYLETLTSLKIKTLCHMEAWPRGCRAHPRDEGLQVVWNPPYSLGVTEQPGFTAHLWHLHSG